MKTLQTILITIAALAIVAIAVCYSGAFNMAGDDHHWVMTSRLVATMRDRYVSRQADGLDVPKTLADDKVIANGAGEYAEMCTGCHLGPGLNETEMRKGMYPMPPNLAERVAHRPPAEQFWVIKHGLKMTGMPAWGLTHDDERIWSLVAFLQKLPSLSPDQYRGLVESGGGHHHHDEMGGHNYDPSQETAEHHHGEANRSATETPDGSGPDEQSKDHHAHDHVSKPVTMSLTAGAADAAAIVDRFQELLTQGDTTAAAELLDPAVLIFESGSVERSRLEYASHHLKEDAAFMKTAKLTPLSRTGNVSGNIAFVATESSLTSHGAKAVELVTTETAVLRRTVQGWRVVHIHWSSRPIK